MVVAYAAAMQYKHTELWPTIENPSSQWWSGLTAEQIEGHMQAWADDGWALVSASTVMVQMGSQGTFPMHSFFWSRA